jgi:hypothetical protein
MQCGGQGRRLVFVFRLFARGGGSIRRKSRCRSSSSSSRSSGGIVPIPSFRPILSPALFPPFLHLDLGSVQKGHVVSRAVPQFPVAPGASKEGCMFLGVERNIREKELSVG